MALPASGAISLSDFNTELGITAGTTISMNDADVRGFLGLASGAEASFSDYYGASSVVDIALTLSGNTNNYNIFSNKGGTYVAGKSNITLTVNSGVTVGSTSTGTYALDTGTGWASGDTITIVNNGTVVGKGGNGGNGATARYNSISYNGTQEAASTAGGAGGHAFRAQFAATITNNGTFAGGGGGGGGAGGAISYNSKSGDGQLKGGGGGGGGAGTNAGSGGSAGRMKNYFDTNIKYTTNVLASSGSSGSATAGGSRGNNADSRGFSDSLSGGGAGGARGSAGAGGAASGTITIASSSSGGAGGNYAVGNSNITWSTTGTRLGGVS
jgi:hypothetical protein